MSNKVVVVFSDGSELPMQGPKTEQTLKLPVEEQAKIFYDAATKSEQGKGKTPVTFGQEGKKQVPFSNTNRPQPSTTNPTPGAAPSTTKPEVKPAPSTTAPATTPSTTAPATAPTAKPEPDSRINDLAKEWEEKAKAKAREEQAAREKAEQAAREKAEADRKEKALQDLIAQKQKEADAAKSKQEADKKAKELEALRAQEAEAKATAEAKAKADEKAKADAEAAAKAKADADAKAAADKKNSPAQTAPSQSAPTPSTNKQEPAPAQTAPAQTAPAQTAQPSKQPSKWDSLRKELGITSPGMAQPNNQPGSQPSTAIQGTTSNTPGTQPGAGNRPGTGNQSVTGTQPGTGNQPSKPAADPAQIQSGGRLPGDGGWKDLGDGTQKWVGPAGIDTSKGPYSGQKIEPGTIVRTPVWKGDDDLSRMYDLKDLEAVRADLRRQRRALDAAQKSK